MTEDLCKRQLNGKKAQNVNVIPMLSPSVKINQATKCRAPKWIALDKKSISRRDDTNLSSIPTPCSSLTWIFFFLSLQATHLTYLSSFSRFLNGQSRVSEKAIKAHYIAIKLQSNENISIIKISEEFERIPLI